MRLVDSHGHLNADRFDGDVELVVGAARLAGLERLMVPGWNERSSARALELVDALAVARRGGRGPSARCRQGRRGRLAADHGLGARRPRARDRRDRARLGPAVLAVAGPARQPAAQPRARARDGQARDPPLPVEGWRAGRPGRARRGAACRGVRRRGAPRGVRGASARRDPLVQRPGRLRGDGRSRWGSRSRSRASCSDAARRHPPRPSRASRPAGCWSRPTSPFLTPPGGPRGRNEPSAVAITARWAAERRGVGEDELGDALVAAYDATFARSRRREA